MQLLPNNKCKIINIVWIERGIILSIIYIIIKNYSKLKDKIIIFDNEKYCNFLKILFTKLNFNKFNKHNKKNYYFNIRKIIMNQDIIFDYLSNYDTINTKRLYLVPWYDMNDPLIFYEKNIKYKMKCDKHKIFIKEFGLCRRGSYNNDIWDFFMEKNIIYNYFKFNPDFIKKNFIIILNNFIKSNYTDTVNFISIIKEYPKVYYINNNEQKEIINNNITVNNEEDMNELISLINKKLNLVNNIII